MDDISWGRIPDDKFSLKRIYRQYGGYGTHAPKETRPDGSKLVFSTDSRVCRGKHCDRSLFVTKFAGRLVYPQFCPACQRGRHDYEIYEIGRIE